MVKAEDVLGVRGEPGSPAPTTSLELAQLPSEQAVLRVDAPAHATARCVELADEALREAAARQVVIVGSPGERALAARLALLGVSGYAEAQPCQTHAPDQALLPVVTAQLCKQAALALVGRTGVKGAQGDLRSTMHRQAVDRREGSFQAAAGVLDVDRRHVARMAT